MIPSATQNVSDVAKSGIARSILRECRTELAWLAFFVTANEDVATACVIDACALAEVQGDGYEKWLMEWARYATVRSAVQMQRVRISQLSWLYEGRMCSHRAHPSLSPDSVEFVVEETSSLVAKVDVLCRSVLLICGIEKRPFHEAALMLGVSDDTVQAAYCSALEYLEVMGCERFRDQNQGAAVCN